MIPVHSKEDSTRPNSKQFAAMSFDSLVQNKIMLRSKHQLFFFYNYHNLTLNNLARGTTYRKRFLISSFNIEFNAKLNRRSIV